MSLLEHLDELRSRLFRAVVGFVVLFAACSAFHDQILTFLLAPIQEHLFGGGQIVYLNLTEPFFIKLKAIALCAAFLSAPWMLYQVWAFVAPGLLPKEARLVVPFLFFGTIFFVGGGAFAYYVAVPIAAKWMIEMGGEFTAQISMRSSFSFLSMMMLGLGAVFQMPIVILILSRIGVVTPAFLMKNFRFAVLIMAILAAVITPSGDWVTMSVVAGPMIVLYLLGVAVAWIAKRRDG